MDAPRRTVELPTGPLTYRETGPQTDEAAAIVFLHGLAGSSLSWVCQFERFSLDHHCLAWDAPGYGESARITPDVDQFAAALDALFDAAGVERANLVGHSMGGVVAARFAARHPSRVARLILSCTHWGGCRPQGSALSEDYRSRLEALDRGESRDYGLARARAMLAPEAPPDVFDLVAEIAARANRTGVEAAARMINEADNRAVLGDLACPVTVISGELDPVVGKKKTDDLAAAIPAARHVVIAGAGHAPYMEKPRDFNFALATCFGQVLA